jgi:hypothetical protein
VIYAALVLGCESGLLHWPENLPMRAVKKCYRRARRAAMTDDELASTGLASLKAALSEPGRLIECEDTARPLDITHATVAVRFRKHGQTRIGVLDEALTRILGGSKGKRRFTRYLKEAGYIGRGHGHAGTTQERLRLRRNARETDRIRLWVMDPRAVA